jgi:sugar phosphate isomerase/epimerase
MDRRMAVQGLAVGAWGLARELGVHLPGPRSPAPDPLSPLGVQLYTVRHEAQRDLDGTLAQLARVGYREVEFWNYYGRTPAQVAQLLAQHGLTSPSVHVGLESLESDAAAATLDASRAIGHRYVVVASTPVAWRRTLSDWRRLAERFNRAGERCRASGLAFGYHNHDFEFTPLEGAVPFDLLCEATDPSLVRLQVDLYWMVAGGRDPVPFLRRWRGRVPSVHVKDRTADARMVDVGAGVIDWRTVLGEARRAGVRHFFVEHDDPPDAFASVRASYEYLSRLNV